MLALRHLSLHHPVPIFDLRAECCYSVCCFASSYSGMGLDVLYPHVLSSPSCEFPVLAFRLYVLAIVPREINKIVDLRGFTCQLTNLWCWYELRSYAAPTPQNERLPAVVLRYE